MGRPSKVTTALVRAELVTATEPLDAREVVRLTARFLELKREAFRSLVDRAIELGELLLEGKGVLRGHYMRWLRERLGIEHQTGENYVHLARLAHDSPAIIQRWKELGPSKLYRLARLPPEGRRVVLKRRDVPQMTDREFSELTDKHLVRRRKVTGNMRAHGLRMQVRAFSGTVRQSRIPDIEAPALRAGLKAEIAGLVRVLRELSARL
jgi:hypothetical protein